MAASISFQATDTDGTTGTSYTLTFTVASAAGQERLLGLATINNNISSAPTYSSVTVDGQAATQVGSYRRQADTSNAGPIVSFWRAAGTSGTSISVTFTVSHQSFSAYGAVWSLNNAGTLLASVDNSQVGFASSSLAVNTNTIIDGVAAAIVLGYTGTTPTLTWTGLTERFDAVRQFGDEVFSGADLTIGSTSTPLSISATFTTLTNSANSAQSAIVVSLNPAAGGTTLTAAAGSYAATGASTGLAWGQVSPTGSYALTGSAAGFVVAVGNVVLTAGSGSYNLSGSTAAFLPPVQPSTGGGYTGGASRGRMIRRFRKKEIEEIVERIEEAAALPSPPPPPAPLSAQPPLIDLMPRMRAAGIPAKTRIAVKQAVEDDDDDEAIELLLNLLS